MNRYTNTALLGFAAVIATLFVVQPKNQSPHVKVDGDHKIVDKDLPSDATQASSYPEGPLKPIYEYFCPPLVPSPKGQDFTLAIKRMQKDWLTLSLKSDADSNEDGYKWENTGVVPAHTTIRFLVATVPDPIESRFGFSFDQLVESIQRALEMDSYVVDRAWLPWKRKSDGTVLEDATKLYQSQPGLVLFRQEKSSDKLQLFALLLVGETPTSGINKPALRNALKLIDSYHEYCQRNAAPQRDNIRVIAPTFSGSHMSLAATLQEWIRHDQGLAFLSASTVALMGSPMGEGPLLAASALPFGRAAHQGSARNLDFDSCPASKLKRLRIICGGAVGFDREQFLTTLAGQKPKQPEGAKKIFRAAVLSNRTMKKWLFNYIACPANPANPPSDKMKQNDVRIPIVVLQETNTGFGQGTKGGPSAKPRENGPGAITETDSTDQRFAVFTVPFPMHISLVREFYDQKKSTDPNVGNMQRPSVNLPFPSENGIQRGKAPIPPQGPHMTAAMYDLALSNLVSVMAEKRARHVLLSATDSRDVVFLANVIRNRYPDVQLYTTVSDLLYAHPDNNYALAGMVIASTYPLQPNVQGLSSLGRPNDVRTFINFTFQDSQGYFNATIAHLLELQPDWKKEACEERERNLQRSFLDYGWAQGNEKKTSPGVWISAVGENGQMIPLHHIHATDLTKDREFMCREFMYERRIPENPDDLPAAAAMTVGLMASPYGQGGVLTASTVASEIARRGEFRSGKTELPHLFTLLALAIGFVAVYLLVRANKYISNKLNVTDEEGNPVFVFVFRIFLFAVMAGCVLVFFSQLLDVAWVPFFYPQDGSKKQQFLAQLLAFGIFFACVGLVILRIMELLCIFWTKCWTMRAVLLSFVVGVPLVYFGLLLILVGAVWHLLFHYLSLSAILGVSIFCLVIYEAACWTLHRIASGCKGVRLLCFMVSLLFTALALVILLRHGLSLWNFANGVEIRPADTLNWSSFFQCFKGRDAAHLIWFERVALIQTRMSPLFPSFFLWGGIVSSVFFLIKKIHTSREWRVSSPFKISFPSGANNLLTARCERIESIGELDQELRAEFVPTRTWVIDWQFWVCIFLFVVFLWTLGHDLLRSFDGTFFDCLVIAGFPLVSLLIAFQLRQFFFAWQKMKKMLKDIALLPMTDAFSRVHERLKSLLGSGISTRHPDRPAFCAVALHQLGLVVEEEKRIASSGGAVLYSLPPLVKEFSRLSALFAHGNKQDEKDEKELADGLDKLSSSCLASLCEIWPAHSMEEAFGRKHEPAGASKAQSYVPNDVRGWTEAAEDFVAISIIHYLSQFMVQFRILLLSLVIGPLMLLMAAVGYPFRPQSILLLALSTIAIAVMVMISRFLYQYNKDEIISRICQTEPNKFNLDLEFLTNFATYILPIVGAILVQLPLFSGFLWSLFEPLIHIIR